MPSLRALVLDDPGAVCLGYEAIRVGDEVCGRVTTGGFGYRTDRSIAYGYLPRELEPGADLEISMFDEWRSAPSPLSRSTTPRACGCAARR